MALLVATTVAAMQTNLKNISKETGTTIPKMSKDLASSTEKCEKIISESQLARMSAKEIEEFYASGGKVEDPALYKAAVAIYKKLAQAVTLIHAKIGQLVNSKVQVDREYVATCKKIVNAASVSKGEQS